jgi:hypothetical protein
MVFALNGLSLDGLYSIGRFGPYLSFWVLYSTVAVRILALPHTLVINVMKNISCGITADMIRDRRMN